MTRMFLAAAGIAGTLLFVLGVLHVPLTRITFALAVIVAAALVIRRKPELPSVEDWLPIAVLCIPFAIAAYTVSILPLADYDGRVTWMPKADAIVREASIRGPFFMGERGLNLHNRYPLLVPLDVAVIKAFGGSGRHFFWLVPFAALLWCFAFVRKEYGRAAAWLVAGLPWLPSIVAAPEGGAMSAYVDLTVMAFTGAALMSIADPRATGMWLTFLVLTKNEGLVIAAAICVTMLVFRGVRRIAWVAVPPLVAALLLAWWRRSIPAAYDEQYELLIRELPSKLDRLDDALLALGTQALDFRQWGLFWLVTLICAAIALTRRSVPALVCVLVFCGYVVTFAVTSWHIEELANVAANRLLTHLLIPATLTIASVVTTSRPA